MTERFDVVVIGAGPGGFAAAMRCAQKGAAVAMVEKGFIGGTCLNVGCIPSKALLASAHTLLTARHAEAMGLNVPEAQPDWARIQQRKDAIVAGFRKGMAATAKAHRVKMYQGRAIVTGPGQVDIETEDGLIGLQTDKLIIATGSRPVRLPCVPLDGRTVISSATALSLQSLPRSMVIIGGGAIGCEMASAYSAFGTKVTIIEALERLLPMEDDWASRLLEREFKKAGIDIFTSRKAASVEKTDGNAKVNLESGEVIEAEKVLVAVGRRAACDKETIQSLGLEMNGACIKVDEKLRTNAEGVFAIGDVVGTTYLAHGASAEADVAAANAAGGDEEMADYSLIPRVVYTFPEVASVGKSEQLCKDSGIDVAVGRTFFKANGRSVTHNETVGEVRVIADKAANTILGVTIVGAMATELVGAATMLIGRNRLLTKITFAHPTVCEAVKQAAEDAFGIDIYNPGKS